jgi:hypothetical protein
MRPRVGLLKRQDRKMLLQVAGWFMAAAATQAAVSYNDSDTSESLNNVRSAMPDLAAAVTLTSSRLGLT